MLLVIAITIITCIIYFLLPFFTVGTSNIKSILCQLQSSTPFHAMDSPEPCADPPLLPVQHAIPEIHKLSRLQMLHIQSDLIRDLAKVGQANFKTLAVLLRCFFLSHKTPDRP